MDRALQNSDRRQYGIGLVGRMFGRSFRRDRITSHVREQLDDLDDHRPFFTYWVTTIQVLVTSLSLQEVDYYESDNFWLGPRAADLIHLGAKFVPCMRKDKHVFADIDKSRQKERHTACCIRNDKSGCVQSSVDDCSSLISTWQKWKGKEYDPSRRESGSVCGQDPSHCSDPPAVTPYDWPDDITKWPICKKKITHTLSGGVMDHMACEVIGHPCCIGILGECHITTREYCDFFKGFFHEEAFLCSQVSCLDDVCGMIRFFDPEVPDQVYRLWTSLFLHAGLIHLAITVVVQYFLMRDLEKMAGCLRIGVIYLMSGIAGNLASAIFIPYRAEVGPAGSQFGLLACLFVEVINTWPILKSPGVALVKLSSMILFLFVVGLLPWVDNYAHVVGFVFGFFLSYALLPFVSFGKYDRQCKIVLIGVCLMLVLVLLSVLLILFYVYPIYECDACSYFNCIPLTSKMCADQNINTTRGEF
uniref:Peptidase S54 rhomboid domain-containing protein n=1 Tax=Strigamia maritima TaxID=126957 RepID=T1JI16_STRMM